MCNLALVEILQRMQDLSSNTFDHIFGHFSMCLEIGRKLATGHILHNDVDPAFVFMVVHIFDNIRLKANQTDIN